MEVRVEGKYEGPHPNGRGPNESPGARLGAELQHVRIRVYTARVAQLAHPMGSIVIIVVRFASMFVVIAKIRTFAVSCADSSLGRPLTTMQRTASSASRQGLTTPTSGFFRVDAAEGFSGAPTRGLPLPRPVVRSAHLTVLGASKL